MAEQSVLEKRLPFARWQIIDLVVTQADFDMVIPHALRPQKATDIRFEVIDNAVGGVVYRGSKLPGLDFIVLRATVVGDYRVRLFIEAHQHV